MQLSLFRINEEHPFDASATFGYTISNNRFTDFVDDGVDFSGNSLPGIPSQKLNSVFSGRIGPVVTKFHYQHIGSQWMNDANDQKYHAYQLLHLQVSWKHSFPSHPLSIEFHGEGVHSLNLSERMTLANLASEMGAKNAVFPPDDILARYPGTDGAGVWADEGAVYVKDLNIDLNEVIPLVAAPHHVDHVKPLTSVEGLEVHQGLIGTCTNGRLEDLREAANILRGRHVQNGFQLQIIPASREIYLQAINEGLISIFLEAGANVLSSSCGPCLGTGQGIPADGTRVISSANRNFLGRMGNKNAEIYLASPAAVALSALTGTISDPRKMTADQGTRTEKFPGRGDPVSTLTIAPGQERKQNGVWDYTDAHNLNTDQMFAGDLTYKIQSASPEEIVPHLMAGFDPEFAANVRPGDIILAGDNFGCGSSREHPSVGLAHAGISAILVRSVNRIFYRSAINQGLPLIVHPDVVDAYWSGDRVEVNLEEGSISVGSHHFSFEPLPPKLLEILRSKGLVNWIRGQ